jgi:hypothetical protein
VEAARRYVLEKSAYEALGWKLASHPARLVSVAPSMTPAGELYAPPIEGTQPVVFDRTTSHVTSQIHRQASPVRVRLLDPHVPDLLPDLLQHRAHACAILIGRELQSAPFEKTADLEQQSIPERIA